MGNTCLQRTKVWAGLVIAIASMPVLAASTWSNLGSACSSTPGSGVAMGNTLSCGTSSGVSLSATAFSTSNGATSTSGTTFATAALYNWGSSYGLGVVNSFENPSSTGPHAIDNQYGTDAVRLSFGSAMNLTSIGAGWLGSDTDMSVLAWTGAGTPGAVSGTTLTGNVGAPGSLLTGWTLVGNYANVGKSGNSASTSISSAIYSSHWLVSAYNTSFGTSNSNANGALGMGALDYFKLLAVAGHTRPPGGSVPEPASLALLGAGLLGLIASRRPVRPI